MKGSVRPEVLAVVAVVLAVVGSAVDELVPALAPAAVDELEEAGGDGVDAGCDGVVAGVEGCDGVEVPVVLENGSQYCCWLAEPDPQAAID